MKVKPHVIKLLMSKQINPALRRGVYFVFITMKNLNLQSIRFEWNGNVVRHDLINWHIGFEIIIDFITQLICHLSITVQRMSRIWKNDYIVDDALSFQRLN